MVSPSAFLFQASGMADKDTLFADTQNEVAPFSFDDKVVSVFSDMIKRSVPGYGQTLQMIELITHQHAQADSNLYDLGCSLGAATMAMQRGLNEPDCRIIGVDNSRAMINRCRDNLILETGNTPVELLCADILEADIENASVVVMNFVMQFIAREKRLELLEKIQQGLRPEKSALTMVKKTGDRLNSMRPINVRRVIRSWKSVVSAPLWKMCWCLKHWMSTMRASKMLVFHLHRPGSSVSILPPCLLSSEELQR
jgi:tRNA (cmo5U34)-methyltransferase